MSRRASTVLTRLLDTLVLKRLPLRITAKPPETKKKKKPSSFSSYFSLIESGGASKYKNPSG